MKKAFIILFAIVVLSIVCARVYRVGLADGEQRYKQSRRMYLALKSAYHFGYIDAHEGRSEDWDGPELAYYCTDCTTPLLCPPNCE